MRIGIDYTAAVRQMGGIGRYTRNLIRALAEIDQNGEYVLWVAGGRRGLDDSDWPPNFHLRTIPLSDRWVNLLWQRMRIPLPIESMVGHLDVFHSPDFVLPPTRSAARTLVTVHDLSFLRVPECFVPSFREYLKAAVRRSVARADAILADSESTRADLRELLGVSDERIAVVYPGVEARFRPIRETSVLEVVQRKYVLPERFILGVGTLQPRKNFTGLIDAFSRLMEPDLQLVLAGGVGWLHEPILETISQRHLQDRVRLLGFVDDHDLPALYSLATVFAFPSWYEGFGLPVLEAMACGTPVVTANNSALPEVAGNAALMVDAASPQELADALHVALVDEVRREELATAGFGHARQFTWERAAAQLQRCYEELRFCTGAREIEHFA
jgi:glycosyltransferase involved in cell wall biosynthesis